MATREANKYNPCRKDSLEERFWFYAPRRTPEECWEWGGPLTTAGYGTFKYKAVFYTAHKVSYRLNVGEIAAGLCVCHSCDNRKCVNPGHLWLGTQLDNIRDMVEKGRARKFEPSPRCRKGHLYAESGIRAKGPPGHGQCVLCANMARNKRRQARRKSV